MSRKIRSALVVLVLFSLLVPAAQALSFAGRVTPGGPEGLLEAAWEWLVSWWTPGFATAGRGDSQNVREKAGSQMDPNGEPEGHDATPVADDECR